MRSALHILSVACLVALAACGDDETVDAADTADTSRDTGRPGRDTGGSTDTAGPDVAPDAAADVAPDGPAPDTGADVSPDTADDVTADATSDTTSDTGVDATPDACVPGCVLEGATACDGATGGLIRCVDVDGCLQFSSPVACSPGTECLGGSCVPIVCEDVCEAGATRCAPGGAGVQGCLDTDGDGCVEWGEPTACPDGACVDGACPGACVDTCVDGTFACTDGGVSQCYDTDADGCVEQGPPIACPAGTMCEAGECVAFAGDCLLLSEVIEGSSNNKAAEIYNCGGPISLDDFIFCVSTNASTNCGFDVSLSGTLEPGEVLTLCHGRISSTWASLCDVSSTAAVIFNGDDRIVLYRDVDADEEFDRGVDEVFDAFGETSRQPGGEIWGNTTYRRCNPEPYDGLGSFDVDRYFSEHGEDDFSDLGRPPDLSGCD